MSRMLPASPRPDSLAAELKGLYQRKAVVDELIRKLEKFAALQPGVPRKPPASVKRPSWTSRLAS